MHKYQHPRVASILLIISSLLLTLLLAGCTVQTSAAPGAEAPAPVRVSVRIHADPQLCDALNAAMTREIAALQGVIVSDQLPDYIIRISASTVAFIEPDNMPAGLSLSIVITRRADSGPLWEMRKELPPKVQKAMIVQLMREEILVEHWQRGGGLVHLEKICRDIAADFERDLLKSEHKTSDE